MRVPFKGWTIVVATATAAVFVVLFPAVTRISGQGRLSQGTAGQPRRTVEGKPDFSGIWQAMNTANWDLQTHEARPMVAQPGVFATSSPVLAAPVLALGAVGGVPPGLGVVEGDEIPYQAWAAARKKENFEHWLDRDPEIKCFFPGVPRAMYLPYPFQVVQGTDKIMMVFQLANATNTQRVIHMDQVAPFPTIASMGHSLGRWEGDTLVVDVTKFTDRTWFDRAGNFHSDALHLVERFTPISRDAIQYEVTIEDPQVFTRPWKISMPLYRRLEQNAQLMEYRCTELVEELTYGHLRKQQLVKRWEGKTLIVDITRKVPPQKELYEAYTSGNPPER